MLQDFSTGRFHRFTPTAYRVIGLMDGQRTMEEIWQLACEELGDDEALVIEAQRGERCLGCLAP